MATDIQIERFKRMLADWTIDQLIDYFARAFASNKFGDTDEEMAIVRAEIHRRVK